MKWLRLYDEARTDAKLESLPDDQFRVWFRLLCFANSQTTRGSIVGFTPRLLAIEVARGDVALLQATLQALEELRIIATDEATHRFINWEKRQFVSDNVSERVNAHRQRSRNGHVTLQQRSGNGHVTPPDTDTEADTYSDGYSEGESKILPFVAAAADADGAAGAARVSDVLELPVLATAAVAGSTNGSGHSANGRTPTPRPQSNGRAKTEASVVQTAPPPSAAPPPAPSRASAANSPRKPARPVNEIWDAMVDVFGYEPESRQERSNWGKIVKGLKEAGATGAEVRRRAANHAASGYAWDLTPNALVTHWGELKDVRVQGANARAKPAAAARASPAPPERFSITSSPPFVITEPH